MKDKNTLNSEQYVVFKEIIERIDSCNENSELKKLFMFVTGNAGCGKSYLLQMLKKHFDKHNVKVECVTYTNMAAHNINGKTLHSFFQINPITNDYSKQRFHINPLNDLDVLIIDEISMISDLYLQIIDSALKYHKKDHNPFGNTHVIAFGDFQQLSPISDIHEDGFDHKRCFFSELWSLFEKRELTYNMRQRDEEFINFLNRLRIGDNSPVVLDYFNRFVVKDEHKICENSIIISATKKEAAFYNDSKLMKLINIGKKTREYFPKVTKKNIDLFKNELPIYSAKIKCDLIPETIKLCVGSRIMCTINHTKSDLYNGDLGTITELCEDSIYVRMDRTHNVELIQEIPLLHFCGKVKNERIKSSIIVEERRGLPIVYGWALTIHKIQGLTMDTIQLDPKRIFAAGQLYVGLSRVKTPKGLILMSPILPSHIINNSVPEIDKGSKRKNNTKNDDSHLLVKKKK